MWFCKKLINQIIKSNFARNAGIFCKAVEFIDRLRATKTVALNLLNYFSGVISSMSFFMSLSKSLPFFILYVI